LEVPAAAEPPACCNRLPPLQQILQLVGSAASYIPCWGVVLTAEQQKGAKVWWPSVQACCAAAVKVLAVLLAATKRLHPVGPCMWWAVTPCHSQGSLDTWWHTINHARGNGPAKGLCHASTRR